MEARRKPWPRRPGKENDISQPKVRRIDQQNVENRRIHPDSQGGGEVAPRRRRCLVEAAFLDFGSVSLRIFWPQITEP